MSGRESRISRQVVRWLNEQPDTWATAVTITGYARRGIPDILACVGGQFLAIEVKQPGKRPTPIQQHELEKLEAAGAVVCVAHSLADAQVAYGIAQERSD